MELSNNMKPIYGVTVKPAFTKSVTTAGTRVQLSADTSKVGGVYIKAKKANTGLIYVGSATVASTAGFGLDAGDIIFYPCNSLSEVYLDSAVNGEGVWAWAI